MLKVQNLFNKLLESKKTFWIVLILVFATARSAVWFYPYDSDHWIFYYVGRAVAGGGLLYVDAWDHKPPLIFEFNALMHLLFGGNLALHRVFLTLLAVLDIFLFYKLASIFTKEFFEKNAEKVTRVALLLYVFWRGLAQFASSGNNTENVGLIFLLLMYLTFLKWLSVVRHQTPDKSEVRSSKSVGYLFLSGICLSALFYLKPNFSLLSLPIILEIFLLSYRSIKKFILNYMIFGIPFLLQTGFWIFYFNSQGALKDFWVASFAFSSAYAKSTWAGNVSPQKVFIFMLLPLVVPLLIFAYRFLKDSGRIKKDSLYRFLFFMFLSSLAFGLALGSFYPYYFLILLPSFVLVIVYGLFSPAYSAIPASSPVIPAKATSDVARSDNITDRKATFDVAGISSRKLVSVIILLGGMAVSLAISTKQLLNSFSGPVKSQLNEYRQIADYVKTNSSENDKIVFYEYGAVMYRLAERDSGSRFISASVLLLDERDRYGFHLSDTFISDLEKSKPKYWIISKDENSLYYQNKKIILYMLNNFSIEKELDNYLVLKRK